MTSVLAGVMMLLSNDFMQPRVQQRGLALSAAALLDLHAAGRVTVDVTSTRVVDPAPTGLPAADAVLRHLVARGPRDPQFVVAECGASIDELGYEQVVQEGVAHWLPQPERAFIQAEPARARLSRVDDREALRDEIRLALAETYSDDPRLRGVIAVVHGMRAEGTVLERPPRLTRCQAGFVLYGQHRPDVIIAEALEGANLQAAAFAIAGRSALAVQQARSRYEMEQLRRFENTPQPDI